MQSVSVNRREFLVPAAFKVLRSEGNSVRVALGEHEFVVRRFSGVAQDSRALAALLRVLALHAALPATPPPPGLLLAVDAYRPPDDRGTVFAIAPAAELSLEQLLARRSPPLDVPQCLAVALGAATALQVLHAHGVVLGDLRPCALAVTLGSLESGRAVAVSDFTCARAVGEARTAPTIAGSRCCYFAPEAVLGLTAQSAVEEDSFGLGALLYELLARQPLFGAVTTVAEYTEQLAEVIDVSAAPPPLRAAGKGRRVAPLQLPAGLPAARQLLTLLRRALSVDPAQRPPVSEFVATLSALLGRQRPTAPSPAPPALKISPEVWAFTCDTPRDELLLALERLVRVC